MKYDNLMFRIKWFSIGGIVTAIYFLWIISNLK